MPPARCAVSRCRSRSSIGATITCSSRCSTRWRWRRSRRATSPRRSAGFSAGRRTSRCCSREAVGVDLEGNRLLLADGALDYDFLIVATGATHAYFGHDEWRPVAPGLKTLEDALEIRRRVLLAFEHAERENDPAKRAALLTFVVIGGGPTGVEMAGALAEISRQSLARDFRHFDPRLREDPPARRRAFDPQRVPGRPARRRAARPAEARRRRADQLDRDRRVAGTRFRGRRRRSRRRRSCGRRAWRRRRSARRSARRSIAPAAC